MIDYGRLTRDQRVGLYANIHALEAQEDVRHALLLGSLLAGKEGADYMKILNNIAWYDLPEVAARAEEMIDKAVAKREHDGK